MLFLWLFQITRAFLWARNGFNRVALRLSAMSADGFCARTTDLLLDSVSQDKVLVIGSFSVKKSALRSWFLGDWIPLSSDFSECAIGSTLGARHNSGNESWEEIAPQIDRKFAELSEKTTERFFSARIGLASEKTVFALKSRIWVRWERYWGCSEIDKSVRHGAHLLEIAGPIYEVYTNKNVERSVTRLQVFWTALTHFQIGQNWVRWVRKCQNTDLHLDQKFLFSQPNHRYPR